MRKLFTLFATVALTLVVDWTPVSNYMIFGGQLARAKTSASAVDLARSYDSTKLLLGMIEIAEMGARIVTSEGVIHSGNAATLRKMLEGRLSNYKKEIVQRGFANLKGRYRTKLSKSCSRVPSWTMLVYQGATSFEMRQLGFEVELLQSKRGTPHVNKMNGVVVENSLVFRDSLNSDFVFTGELKDGEITIRPDPSVLKSWPNWANPPKRTDLKNCKVILFKP